MDRAPVAQSPSSLPRARAPHPRPGRRRAVGALGLVATGMLAPTAASAADYRYTSQCTVWTTAIADTKVARSFRARLPVARDTTSSNRWNISGYQYWYEIGPNGDWGPRSDERLTMAGGRINGASPWHSPDSHTSDVAWVAETGWKGQSSVGNSVIAMHAWFDVPSQNDPECDVITASF